MNASLWNYWNVFRRVMTTSILKILLSTFRRDTDDLFSFF